MKEPLCTRCGTTLVKMLEGRTFCMHDGSPDTSPSDLYVRPAMPFISDGIVDKEHWRHRLQRYSPGQMLSFLMLSGSITSFSGPTVNGNTRGTHSRLEPKVRDDHSSDDITREAVVWQVKLTHKKQSGMLRAAYLISLCLFLQRGSFWQRVCASMTCAQR